MKEKERKKEKKKRERERESQHFRQKHKTIPQAFYGDAEGIVPVN